MAQGTNLLYGQTGVEGQNRFGIAGDLRRMYPVSPAGGLKSVEWAPHRVQSGGLDAYLNTNLFPFGGYNQLHGMQNLISNGSSVWGLGSPTGIDGTVRALRLGVTGTTGGNHASSFAEYARIITNEIKDTIFLRSVLYNGEAYFRDTNAATPQLGASSEPFTLNVGGTVTVANGATSVTGNATTFTTASIAGAASQYNGIYVGNLPSDALLHAGDIILITLDAGGRYYARITAVNAANGAGALTISPAAPGASTAQAYTLLRTGYGSLSRVVTIYNGDYSIGWNYYCGSSPTGLAQGTINAWSLTGQHSTAPQTTTTAGTVNVANLGATDIAYYKGFLLYGAGGNIGWSVAGFPTNFTVGFGAGDFPSGNVSRIEGGDVFISFEYLGDELIAMFENSMWQVQATGSVPEFNFYKLPEPVGVQLQKYGNHNVVGGASAFNRPTCSARSSIFYWSTNGLMQLTGGTARNVSLDVYSALQQYFGVQIPGNPSVTWDPVGNIIILSTNSDSSGFMYQVDSETWSFFKGSTIRALDTRAVTGDGMPTSPQLAMCWYSPSEGIIHWIDSAAGGPYSPIDTASSTTAVWATPIIGLGDEYGSFPMAGFQLDGAKGTTGTYQVYAGNTPYSMEVVQSGSVDFYTDRQLLGKKIDSAFVGIVFTLLGGPVGRPFINGVNIYPEGRGK